MKYAHQRCCSNLHVKRLGHREARADGRDRPPVWSDKRRDNYHRRRAMKKAATTGAPVLLASIAARDEWACGICGEPVDAGIAWPDPMSPSLDHVVPLSRGGAHDPTNVQLAHLRCNAAKGARAA